MGKKLDYIPDALQRFIQKQKVFFVATAPKEGFINLSPKGLDSFYIQDPKTIYWLNLTGSGNETEAHLQEDTRMTIMFNSFDKEPLILRLYGTARSIHSDAPEFDKLLKAFGESRGARQIIELKIELLQTSCGFGVPLMEFKGERPTLSEWANRKGEEGVLDYQKANNAVSLNGKSIKGF